jgi:hypothetical protein
VFLEARTVERQLGCAMVKRELNSTAELEDVFGRGTDLAVPQPAWTEWAKVPGTRPVHADMVRA